MIYLSKIKHNIYKHKRILILYNITLRNSHSISHEKPFDNMQTTYYQTIFAISNLTDKENCCFQCSIYSEFSCYDF